MRVGVPQETWPGETRVALIPAGVTQLKKTGVDVVIERDAGTAAGFLDAAYVQAGAEIASRIGCVLDVRHPPPSPVRSSGPDAAAFAARR